MDTQVLKLKPLNEQRDIARQGACEVVLTEVLDGLAGLVAVSDMPIGSRVYLMNGISHLRSHISTQTNELQATAQGRLN